MRRTVLHIFVSSTWLDLQPERAAVEAALQRLRETKFVGMEYFGSRDEDTRHTSLDEVDCSQVYVGIFGGRYGSGITEAEYRRARELGLPRFIYLKDEATIPPEGRETDLEKAARLAALKAELLEHHTISTFNTPSDLAARVTADLHRWLFDEYLRPPVGIPFQAPTVPRYFVPRPEVSQALMDYLIADAPPGALVVSAVHGLGGIGKTTLVAALAHNPDVQTHFPDGVLWATLGQQPGVLLLLAGWIQALGDYDFRPTVLEMTSAHLRTLLHDKACLLVVDDAWQADHARPFLVGGPRCRLVVTTRNAALARKVGARLYDLDVMTETQALALFQARLGPLDGDREQATALARELGYLPLALELAVAQVEAGFSWAELLDAFRQGLADLAALDLDEATYRNESLRLSFRLSLEQLSSDDQDAFVWLGVLPEDARLNPAMAATLWDQPEADARKRLRRLRDRALLKQVGDDRYILHDLLHDEAKLRLVERMPLPEAHAMLLERYQQKVPDEQWHSLPDDGYVHEHLTWHMEQAGQAEAIHALLRLETSEGRNAWYEAREALGQTAGYLDEVGRVWRLAEGEFAIGLQCRYALITASLNSLAQNLPPELLVALVREKVWTPAQGLAYAGRVPDPESKAEALVGLASHLSERLLKEALVMAREIELAEARAQALTGLAFHLPIGLRERTLHEALAVTQEMWSSRERAQALVDLAPYLPAELREQALREMMAVMRESRSGDHLTQVFYEFDRVGALTVLALHLSEPLLRDALAMAQEIVSEQARAQALGGLAPYLPSTLLRRALTAVQGIKDKKRQVDAMTGLIPYLPAVLRERTLREALAVARQLPERYEDLPVANNPREEALAGLLPRLAELDHLEEALAEAREIEQETARAKALAAIVFQLADLVSPEEALAVTREIENAEDQAEALVGLAPCLSERLLREALTLAREIEWAEYRAEALVGLAPYLSKPLLLETLGAVREIEDERLQAEALVGLAPHLPGGLRQRTLREALGAVKDIGDRQQWVKTAGGLTPYLPARLREPALRKILAMARNVGRADHQASALAEIAPQLPERLLGEALAAVRDITNDTSGARAEALAGLAPCLSEQLLREALATALEIEWEKWQVKALTGLLPRLVELGYPQEALATAREIKDITDRSVVLSGLAPHLPEALREQALQEALAAAREIKDADDRVGALSSLAPHLPETLREQVLQEAFAMVWEIESEPVRVVAMAMLAPHLAERLLRQTLAAVREFESEQGRMQTLERLLPRLAELGHPEEAVIAAREITSSHFRVKTLAALIPYLSLQLREQLLQEAREMADAEVLTELAPRLPKRLREQGLQDALAAARTMWGQVDRAEVLAGLAPHLAQFPRQRLYTLWQETLPILAARTREDLLADLRALSPVVAALGGEKTIVETFHAIQDVGRWWP